MVIVSNLKGLPFLAGYILSLRTHITVSVSHAGSSQVSVANLAH